MANQEHVKQLKQGIDGWNRWRDENREIEPDLSEANLSGAHLFQANLEETNLSRADLSGADLREALLYHIFLNQTNLSGANLSRADLYEATLNEADLSGANLFQVYLRRTDLYQANLSGANLSGADLHQANLSSADLHQANLSEADLYQANLYQADLSGAKLEHTAIAKADLRATKGLTTIQHGGPSYIELFSVQLPQDGSALHFLRGTGVPNEWIDFWRATMMHPIQYHSCFISYSSNDEIVAKRLYADLQSEGVRCWFAPEDMKIGDRIRQRIDEAIHVHEKLLLLLSEQAIESKWVEDEVEAALEKEARQKRGVLFPIRLDNIVMQTTQAWAATLRRTRHIGDFSKWTDPQAYQTAFERLLRDLKRG